MKCNQEPYEFTCSDCGMLIVHVIRPTTPAMPTRCHLCAFADEFTDPRDRETYLAAIRRSEEPKP